VHADLETLAYRATDVLLNTLKEYYELAMAHPTDEEDMDEVEKKHEITKHYCATMSAGVVPFEPFASGVLLQFTRHGKLISELIKSFLANIRQRTKNDSRMMIGTLQACFEAIQTALASAAASSKKGGKSKGKKAGSGTNGSINSSQASGNGSGTGGDDDEDAGAGPASDAAYEGFRRLAFRLSATYGLVGQMYVHTYHHTPCTKGDRF
jgi:hypothetical protein